MATVQLSALRSRAQTRADMVNSTFVSTAEWNAFLNESAAELYDMLVAAYEDYFAKASSTLTATVAGQELYSLDSDFYKLLGVDLKLDSVNWKAVRPYVYRERNTWKNVTVSSPPDYDARYRLRQGQLSLLPVPTSVVQMIVTYVPQMTALVGDTDTFDGVNGWEVFVVLDAARKALQKEESDTSDVERELQTIRERIASLSADRDAGEPEKVGDVYADDYWGE